MYIEMRQCAPDTKTPKPYQACMLIACKAAMLNQAFTAALSMIISTKARQLVRSKMYESQYNPHWSPYCLNITFFFPFASVCPLFALLQQPFGGQSSVQVSLSSDYLLQTECQDLMSDQPPWSF